MNKVDTNQRPASITVIAALLFLFGAGALLLGLILILSLKDMDTDLPYLVMILFGALVNLICGIGILCGKNWGRIAFLCLQPVVFLFHLYYQVREILNPAFDPESHFYNNLLSIVFESLRPIAFYAACVYFLYRPNTNPFFQRSSQRNLEPSISSPTKRQAFSYTEALFKVSTFRGRASIAEFWLFYCINLILFEIPFLAFVVWYSQVLSSRGQDSPDFGPLPFLFVLPIPFLMLSCAVRRLHDSGKSGWWLLLGLIPGIGTIIVLVLLLLPGETRENRYGPAVGDKGLGWEEQA